MKMQSLGARLYCQEGDPGSAEQTRSCATVQKGLGTLQYRDLSRWPLRRTAAGRKAPSAQNPRHGDTGTRGGPTAFRDEVR